MLLGTLEAGGTKMVMGIADESMKMLRTFSCPTRSPEETMKDVLGFFENEKIDAMGIATFGPVDLNLSSPTYGSLTNTPKLAWRDFALYKTIRDALSVPCAIDTDVNAAVLAEVSFGAAQGLQNCLYLTVGTGIGGGLMCEGSLVHGMIHPEWGHIPLNRSEDDPLTRGVCPYHAVCAEGLASGPSMQTRWAMPASDLPEDHRAWDLEAFYLAQICLTALLTVSTERIILGGGVMHHTALFPMIRTHLNHMLGGYLMHERIKDLDSLVVPADLYPNSGLIGGALLALDKLSGN